VTYFGAVKRFSLGCCRQETFQPANVFFFLFLVYFHTKRYLGSAPHFSSTYDCFAMCRKILSWLTSAPNGISEYSQSKYNIFLLLDQMSGFILHEQTGQMYSRRKKSWYQWTAVPRAALQIVTHGTNIYFGDDNSKKKYCTKQMSQKKVFRYWILKMQWKVTLGGIQEVKNSTFQMFIQA